MASFGSAKKLRADERKTSPSKPTVRIPSVDFDFFLCYSRFDEGRLVAGHETLDVDHHISGRGGRISLEFDYRAIICD